MSILLPKLGLREWGSSGVVQSILIWGVEEVDIHNCLTQLPNSPVVRKCKVSPRNVREHPNTPQACCISFALFLNSFC